MKQRLGIAMALLGSPELLILDEPTNGLDPAGIQEMRALIAQLPERTGATVLLSSHLLGEMEQMATQVGILDHGRLLFEGPLPSCSSTAGGRVPAADPLAGKAFPVLERGAIARPPGCGRADGAAPLPEEALADLVAGAGRGGAGVVELHTRTKTLEEIFLTLTQSGKLNTLYLKGAFSMHDLLGLVGRAAKAAAAGWAGLPVGSGPDLVGRASAQRTLAQAADAYSRLLFVLPLVHAVVMPVSAAVLASRLWDCETWADSFKLLYTLQSRRSYLRPNPAGAGELALITGVEVALIPAAAGSLGFAQSWTAHSWSGCCSVPGRSTVCCSLRHPSYWYYHTGR